MHQTRPLVDHSISFRSGSTRHDRVLATALGRTLTPVATAAALALSSLAGAQSIGSDDFEAATLGALPDCPWLDVGLIDPTLPDPPNPSAIVANVAGPSGRSSKALQTVDAIAPTQGLYALVPVSSVYTVVADLRVDRYSDAAAFTTSDWAIQIGVGKLDGSTDLAFTPQVGIYASSLTQGWRLYADGAGSVAFADIDLELPATLGTWYRVEVVLTAATGSVRSRIWDAATDTLLVDRTDVVEGWSPSDGVFDRLMVIDGELSAGVTISNAATVDNVIFNATPATPPGPQGDLNGDGIVDGADLGILLANWTM